MEKSITKSFPSNIALDLKTFLNDPKINAELYSYLLSISYGRREEGQGITYINKKDFPTMSKLALDLHKCRQTITKQIKYLIEKGYLIEGENEYVLSNPEGYNFNVPLDTIKYLSDVVKEEVIKVYIYLGVCYTINPQKYRFTNKEICQHLGLNYQNNSSRITNILIALYKFKLINYDTIFDENHHPVMVLTYHTTQCPTIEE